MFAFLSPCAAHPHTTVRSGSLERFVVRTSLMVTLDLIDFWFSLGPLGPGRTRAGVGNPDFAGIGKINPDTRASGISGPAGSKPVSPVVTAVMVPMPVAVVVAVMGRGDGARLASGIRTPDLEQQPALAFKFHPTQAVRVDCPP